MHLLMDNLLRLFVVDLVGDTSIASSLTFALIPIAKVLLMCGIGYLLATDRIALLTPSGIKTLSKLVFLVFLPSLIFTELGSAITFQKLQQWWFIPANIILSSTIGCLIGCLVVKVIKPPEEFRKFTIIAVGIGNIGNIPLVLLDAICSNSNSPFGEYATCNEESVAYISFGQWVGAVIVYTFGYYMLSPPRSLECESICVDKEGQSTIMKALITDSTVETFSWKTKFARAIDCIRGIRWKQIFQPPVSASILALVVGCIPFLKNLIFTEDAPLYFVSSTLSILGEAMIPCIMLVLGANLIGGPGNSMLGLRTTVAITFTRLLIIPAVGIGIVLLAKKLGCLPADNELFEFVLLLQHSMPTSILAGGVAALRGVAVKEAASILFWEHILCVVSIGFWLVVFLNIVS